jgi:hypothetical protein
MWYRRRKFGYDFRRIDLGEGKWTIVDQRDYYRFGQYKWNIEGNNGKFYAIRGAQISPKEIKLVRLHRVIMSAPEGLLVDHRNNDGLDNRRSNLRLATKSQNNTNRPKRANTSSRYIGVCYDKAHKCWYAQIVHQGKHKWLGTFDNEIEAARAFDRAAIEYHGEFARLNFP